MHLRLKMRDNQVEDIWLSGHHDECGNTITKLLLPPNNEPRCTTRDNINPDQTTAGSLLEFSPSGSDQLDTKAPSHRPHHKDISRNVNVSQTVAAGGEAESTKHCAPHGSMSKTFYQLCEKDQHIVHRREAEGGLAQTSHLRANIYADDELQAFSRKLQQALLEVKREAEDGFLTAKASVYRRLVEQLHLDREKDLQRLEEARQEAEGARDLLLFLRKSKETTEERFSRMFIFLRRRILRQQARQQQQEALQRWRWLAVRRNHQRREQAFVIAAGERARILRVFFPWRIASLRTVSARLQQSATRHTQVAMDNQMRRAQDERAQHELVVEQLRQRLQAETATRMRLQENLCQILLQGASAVYSTKENGCRETLLKNQNVCQIPHVAKLSTQPTLHATGTRHATGLNPEVSIEPLAAPASTNNQEFGSCWYETSSKGSTADTVGRTQKEPSTKINVGVALNPRLSTSHRATVISPQQSTNALRQGHVSFVADKIISTKPTNDGHVVEGARPAPSCSVTRQPIRALNVSPQQIHGCLAESNSLEVIGHMLVPHLLSDSLSAKPTELLGTNTAASERVAPLSCCEGTSHRCCCGQWYKAGTPADEPPHKCHGQLLGKGKWCINRLCDGQPSTSNVRADQPLVFRRGLVRLGIGSRKDRGDKSALPSARVADHLSCVTSVNRSHATTTKINPLSLPGEHDNGGCKTGEKHRVRSCKLSQETGRNWMTSVHHRVDKCGKAATGPPRSTVTYPGGVEANQRNARRAFYAVGLATQDSTGSKLHKAGEETPCTYTVCPKLDIHAEILHSKKDCSWVQSC